MLSGRVRQAPPKLSYVTLAGRHLQACQDITHGSLQLVRTRAATCCCQGKLRIPLERCGQALRAAFALAA